MHRSLGKAVAARLGKTGQRRPIPTPGRQPGPSSKLDRRCHIPARCLVLALEREDVMFKWLMHRGIAAFERQWNYDAGYVHEMIDADPRAAWMFRR